MTAIARADLADALERRAGAGDRERAASLWRDAIESARAMGLAARVEAWSVRGTESDDAEPRASTAPAAAVGAVGCWQRRGPAWHVEGCGEEASVPHSVGMGYLATLLAAPGQEMAAASLAGVDIVQAPQPILDQQALKLVRRRVEELEEAEARALMAGRQARADRLRTDRDELLTHLQVATGLGGARSFDDAAERARTAVQKALRRAVRNVRLRAPTLADALAASLHTGHRCRYDPVGDAPRRWRVDVTGG